VGTFQCSEEPLEARWRQREAILVRESLLCSNPRCFEDERSQVRVLQVCRSLAELPQIRRDP